MLHTPDAITASPKFPPGPPQTTPAPAHTHSLSLSYTHTQYNTRQWNRSTSADTLYKYDNNFMEA